jgi:hypothetical protein
METYSAVKETEAATEKIWNKSEQAALPVREFKNE